MGAEEAGLLAAVAASPGDDSIRLIYADYLEEHGNERRAEFLRVGVELAKPPRSIAEYTRLCQRSEALLDTWWFRGDLECPTQFSGLEVSLLLGTHGRAVLSVHRGFASTLTCHNDCFRHYGIRIVCTNPAITRVKLTDVRISPFLEGHYCAVPKFFGGSGGIYLDGDAASVEAELSKRALDFVNIARKEFYI